MSALDYVTFKYVVIRDQRLGAAYYVMAVLVLMYALMDIFWNKAYLQVRTLYSCARCLYLVWLGTHWLIHKLVMDTKAVHY